jgi:hypothetical protein
MDPSSGRVLTHEQLESYRRVDPEDAARFTVQLNGPEEDIQRISEAVKFAISAKDKEQRRAKNKAARKARKAGN